MNIPLVATSLSAADRTGTILTRIGIKRDHYAVSPGLYGVGAPHRKSPVIVTANYKLSFDTVRSSLAGQDAWLLVLDTCGINVWCAAGKGTFSTDELVLQITRTGLEQIVDHRHVVVPQLGATGVAAHKVKERSGFSVRYGPVRAADLVSFLNNNFKAAPEMRQVSFSLAERTVLIPVEFYLLARSLWWIVPLLFVISGIDPSIFSVNRAWDRGLVLVAATFAGIGSGTILVPLLLPYLPGRAFSLKGLVPGIICGSVLVYMLLDNRSVFECAAVWLWVCSVSSYLAMNFTGSTPFTSGSGVEWEMRRAIPLQALAAVAAALLWILAPFIG